MLGHRLRITTSRCLLAGAVLAAAGCATAPPPAAPPASRAAQTAEPAPAASQRVPPASRPVAGPGQILRSDLDRVLERGPQDLIRRIGVRPVFRQGKFQGWRIISYSGPGPIETGDVVIHVNHQGLERPEDFMLAWKGLAHADELVVELLRGGKPVTLKYDIVD